MYDNAHVKIIIIIYTAKEKIRVFVLISLPWYLSIHKLFKNNCLVDYIWLNIYIITVIHMVKTLMFYLINLARFSLINCYFKRQLPMPSVSLPDILLAPHNGNLHSDYSNNRGTGAPRFPYKCFLREMVYWKHLDIY